ncbi:MAG: redoxin domain-containing protein [Verrucomicrobia bacterium]|nr:redoxin domain-containing protein [Verrucomicrobiota bacterium]
MKLVPCAVIAAALIVGPVIFAAPRPAPGPARQVPPSSVVRPAPEFAWSSVAGKVRRLRDLRGQPVVLVFATGPAAKDFARQVKQITRQYRLLAARNAVFFVAFTKETGVITRSDVPFIVLPDPESIADEYQVGDFGIAIIGPDGNLDYATDRVIPGQRILDVINNSFQVQAQQRRG